MATTITAAEWLKFVQTEYFGNFISEGGSSVKFAVPLDEPSRNDLETGLNEQARNAGYISVYVSSDDTRVHMMDRLFFRIAEQIPWRQLSENVLVRLAKEKKYRDPVEDKAMTLVQRIADANSIDPDMVITELREPIQRAIFRNKSLSRDFRVAATQLCLAELSGGPDGIAAIEVIEDWLTGRNKAISAVKPYQIFSGVKRTNARHLLESLLLWIRFAGYSGLVVTIDLSRVTIARNPKDDLQYFTRAAMLDTYEVLRQFIDATDRMSGCFITVLPAAEFLDPDPAGRGIGAYAALKFRVYDEIHDQRLVNPMGALVRVSDEGNTAWNDRQ